jgi:ferredoxin
MNQPTVPPIKVTVDHDRCVGVGMCVMASPGGFDFDDEGLSVFQAAGEWSEDQLVEAAHSCPSSAIAVYRNGQRIA